MMSDQWKYVNKCGIEPLGFVLREDPKITGKL